MHPDRSRVPAAAPARCNVLVTTDVEGQSKEGYEALFAGLARALRAAPYLVAHAARPVPGGWQIVEIWRSREAADAFFRAHVRARLPATARVRRTALELHNLLLT